MIQILVTLLMAGSLAAVFFVPLHQYPGAAVLGADAILADLLLQWFRFRIMRRNQNTGRVFVGILGGLAARVLSIYVFIRIAMAWLGTHSNWFYLFAIILLSIPLWSILLGLRFKKELS